MSIVKKLKVVDPRVQYINDVDGTYSDSDKPAVKIIQSISVSYNEFINEELADAEMWHKSLKQGTLKKFINEGLIKVFYVNEDTGEEVSKEVYNNFLNTGATSISESSKIAKILGDSGITAEKLADLINKSKEGKEQKVNVSAEVTQGVKKQGVLLEKTEEETKIEPSSEEVIISPKPKIYEDYSKLPYHKLLKSIPTIMDTKLLEEILSKDKRLLVIRTVNKRLDTIKSIL